MSRITLTSLFLLLTPLELHAHGGGLDSYGCHNETATGTYHCHQGDYAGQSFSSKQAFLDLLDNTTDPDPPSTYNREDYLPVGWADADGDCINTRHEVLILESLIPVTMSSSGCYVSSGLWGDPYTGLTFTDPSDVDVDHVVPLYEAHQSGAAAWPAAKKQAFANDMLNKHVLIAVDDGTNSSKGAKDPAEWLPPNAAYHCEYARNWVEIKESYGLEFDAAEINAIEDVLGENIHHATRPTQNGIHLDETTSTARFSLGLTRNNGCPYYTDATEDDYLNVTASITPEEQHIGKGFDVFLVARIGEQLYAVSPAGQLEPMDVDPEQLIVFSSDVFRETYEFTLYEGNLGATDVEIFVAYWPEDGELIFTPIPFNIVIN